MSRDFSETLESAHKLFKPCSVGPSGKDFWTYQPRRVFDVAISSLALYCSPVPFLMLAEYLTLTVLGHDKPLVASFERPFSVSKRASVLKFRTMPASTPPSIGKSSETLGKVRHPIVKLIRNTSLDELPRLENVARGDLALVGSDLLADDEWDRVMKQRGDDPFKTNIKLREDGMPGAMSLYHLFGRGKLSLEERIMLDNILLDNINMTSYLKIFLLGLTQPFKMSGA